MMNAPVVMQSAQKLATKVCALPDEQRLTQVFAMLYGRQPSEHEKEEVRELLRDFTTTEKPERAWALVCQTLLAANEFIYLR